MAPIYLLIKNSYQGGSKYFSRCLYMKFVLVWTHSEVIFHILKPFWFSKTRRRWNGAAYLSPWYLLLTLKINLWSICDKKRVHLCILLLKSTVWIDLFWAKNAYLKSTAKLFAKQSAFKPWLGLSNGILYILAD